MTGTLRLLRTTDGYDVRRVNGALIHLGMVRRDGHEWTAKRPMAQTVTVHPTRRAAVAELSR